MFAGTGRGLFSEGPRLHLVLLAFVWLLFLFLYPFILVRLQLNPKKADFTTRAITNRGLKTRKKKKEGKRTLDSSRAHTFASSLFSLEDPTVSLVPTWTALQETSLGLAGGFLLPL